MKQIKKNLWIVWTVSMILSIVAFFAGDTEIVIIFSGIAIISSVLNFFN